MRAGRLIVLARECFRILGVPESAPDSEIKRAYRRMVMELHPDTGQRPDNLAFSRVVEAYRSISSFKSARRILDFPPRPEASGFRKSQGVKRTRAERNWGQNESLHSLGNTLLNGKTPYQRSFAALRLGNSGQKSSYVYLRKALQDKDPQVVISSVRAIGKLKIDYATQDLFSLFRRGDIAVKSSILETLMAIDNYSAFREIIIKGMQDTSSVIRRKSLRLFNSMQQKRSAR